MNFLLIELIFRYEKIIFTIGISQTLERNINIFTSGLMLDKSITGVLLACTNFKYWLTHIKRRKIFFYIPFFYNTISNFILIKFILSQTRCFDAIVIYKEKPLLLHYVFHGLLMDDIWLLPSQSSQFINFDIIIWISGITSRINCKTSFVFFFIGLTLVMLLVPDNYSYHEWIIIASGLIWSSKSPTVHRDCGLIFKWKSFEITVSAKLFVVESQTIKTFFLPATTQQTFFGTRDVFKTSSV